MFETEAQSEPEAAAQAETAAPRFHALVPCAGVGARAGGGVAKQYLPIAGRAMVAWTLAALARVKRLDTIGVVLAPGDVEFQAAVPDFGGTPTQWAAHCGGATRALTVAAGLAELARRGAGARDWVLVHDAARCLIEPAWVDRLIDACAVDPVGGLLAMPVTDTLKGEAQGRVAETIPRERKWVAQTPQMFRLGELAAALAAAGEAVTDEASALEMAGRAPRLVEGHARNMKVTWPEDIALAGMLLGERRQRIQAFVPAKDFALSKRFYADLGFTLEWSTEALACFQQADASFLLQAFYEPAHAQNFVMHMLVADVQAWWEQHVLNRGLVEAYGIRAEPPTLRPWGLIDLVLIDPTGVLWRVAQLPDDDAESKGGKA